jgi:hypothetical protein
VALPDFIPQSAAAWPKAGQFSPVTLFTDQIGGMLFTRTSICEDSEVFAT